MPNCNREQRETIPSSRLFSIFLIASLSAFAQSPPERLLMQLPAAASLDFERAGLRDALGNIGASLKGGYVLFGVEQWIKHGKQPEVSVHIQPGTTLKDILEQIMPQLPGYDYRFVSDHLINIYPADVEGDPNDPLNTAVPRLNITARPSALISEPEHFIPELRRRLYGSSLRGEIGSILEGIEPQRSFELENVTVRDVLNAATESMIKDPGIIPHSGGSAGIARTLRARPVTGQLNWAALASRRCHNCGTRDTRGNNGHRRGNSGICSRPPRRRRFQACLCSRSSASYFGIEAPVNSKRAGEESKKRESGFSPSVIGGRRNALLPRRDLHIRINRLPAALRQQPRRVRR